jgi:predicted TIM-barrel fold metal-dependent hydrolase
MKNSIWQKKGSLAEAYWNKGAAGFPVYDMHGHMGSHYAIYFKRCQAPEMLAHLKRAGVKILAFSHHDALWGSLRNQQVYEICRQYPETLRFYLAINPHFPEHIKEDLAKFESWRPLAIGLKLLSDYHRVPLSDPKYQYALDFANERGLPVLCHTWGGSQYNGGPVMLQAAQKYKQAKFFMGHSIFGDWEYARRCVLESHGNVWLELTAIPGERGIIEKLVTMVGSQRLLFGTDLPWFDEFLAIGGVLAAKISEEDMKNILWRNAETILQEGGALNA